MQDCFDKKEPNFEEGEEEELDDEEEEGSVCVTYYAVFDGHGGAECALYLKAHLHHNLIAELSDEISGLKESEDINECLSNAITKAFEECDREFREAHKDTANTCGATAVVVLILGNKLVCANVGDARALLCRNGKAIDLSIDHKAVSSKFFNPHIVQRR
jgi:serine/threonine protein phosphatase PrpC